jgi:hypothetical protein
MAPSVRSRSALNKSALRALCYAEFFSRGTENPTVIYYQHRLGLFFWTFCLRGWVFSSPNIAVYDQSIQLLGQKKNSPLFLAQDTALPSRSIPRKHRTLLAHETFVN